MHWRVDAVDPCGTTTGAVWTFITVAPTFTAGTSTPCRRAPPGVTCVTIRRWGAGGSGEGQNNSQHSGDNGGGGGGGGYSAS